MSSTRRLVHHHRLKTPLQRRVLFDVFAIFVERRRADRAQFAARQLRLEQIRRIDRAFRRARADDGVQLVDEENDLALRIGHLLEERLQPVLEFAAEFRAGDHRADVHRDEPLVLQRLRHVAADDAARQTFDDRRLADARLADEHRIVLRPAREHLHHAPDFVVAPDDRIDLPAPRQLGQIAAVFFQRLIFPLGILIRHPLRAAHLLQAPASTCRASRQLPSATCAAARLRIGQREQDNARR